MKSIVVFQVLKRMLVKVRCLAFRKDGRININLMKLKYQNRIKDILRSWPLGRMLIDLL